MCSNWCEPLGRGGSRKYGIWELRFQRGPGAESLVRGSGGRMAPEAEALF